MTGKKQQSHDEALARLQLEYMSKRREIERERKKAERVEREKTVAEGRKLVATLRRQYSLSDARIAKRLGLAQEKSVN